MPADSSKLPMKTRKKVEERKTKNSDSTGENVMILKSTMTLENQNQMHTTKHKEFLVFCQKRRNSHKFIYLMSNE